MREAVGRLTAALQAWVLRADTSAGVKHLSIRYLKMPGADLEVIAFIAVQVLLDSLTQPTSYLTTANTVASAIEDEVRFAQIKKNLPMDWRRIKRRLKLVSPEMHRKALRNCVAKLEADWEPWDRKHKYSLGAVLIELMATATGLVKVTLVSSVKGGRSQHRRAVVCPTEEALAWLTNTNELHKNLYPFYLPTVVPPEPWVGPKEGGYPANIFMRWPLVKQHFVLSKADSPPADLNTEETAPKVYSAVNALQETPWVVNDNVYAVFSHFWSAEDCAPIADLPARQELSLPPTPINIDTDLTVKARWKRDAALIHSKNNANAARRILIGKINFIAQKYQHQEFWFPHKLDFRGRAYPIPAFLQPQGCSLAKGLLLFSEAMPLDTASALDWWMVHGANTHGEGKRSFQNRIQWVTANDALLTAISEDPISNRSLWEHADSPWQFLAFAFEYAEWKADPTGFKSRIPVAMDGTNNGLQLYSLLLRDPVGAAATNVLAEPYCTEARDSLLSRDCTPHSASVSLRLCTSVPKDIYQDVSDAVTRRMQSISVPYMNPEGETDAEMSANWLGFVGPKGFPRGAAKRPVMVLPYGGTMFSVREYVEAWYIEEIEARRLELKRPFSNTYIHTQFLTRIMIEEIHKVVSGAVVAMEWLRDIAFLSAEHKTALLWTTPSGFGVYQKVPNMARVVIRTAIGSICRKRNATIPLADTVSGRGQANSFAPNFVHSIDAAIMTLTTEACARDGAIKSFAMVHDSFAVHAANASLLSLRLRECVRDMFSRDLLSELEAEVRQKLPLDIKLPERPPLGALVSDCVMTSPYFFA